MAPSAGGSVCCTVWLPGVAPAPDLVEGGDPVSQGYWGTQSWGGVALDPVRDPDAMCGADYRERLVSGGAELQRLCPLLVE